MADIRKLEHSSSENSESKRQGDVNIASIEAFDEDSNHHLHRGLKARQITMIAIGGAIETGLIIGTGKSLAQAGPAALLIGYTLVGFLCFLVMAALGQVCKVLLDFRTSCVDFMVILIHQMAAWLPLPSGFTAYATRFVDPALGFALGWNYWFKVSIRDRV